MEIDFTSHGIAEQRKVCDAATKGPWARCDAPEGAESEGEQGTPSNMKLCEKCGKLSVYDHYFRKFICTDCQHSEAAPSGAWEGDK